ncbi:MAG: Spy/CpxP family protein refolding chaperone [Planctomycetota bacterium]
MARHPRLARAMRHREQAREGVQRLLESLQATDSQRAVALEAARAAEPIAREARAEAARIRTEILAQHGGDRAAAREEMKQRTRELRAKTLAKLAPHAGRVLATLTPEQRKKLDDAATSRGRTLDETRLTQITSFLLTRPATVRRLESKLGR